MSLTLSNCDEWEKKKNIHPVTGKGLQKGKTPYNNVETACKELKEKELKKKIKEDIISVKEIKQSIEEKLEKFKISDEEPTINKLKTTVILFNNPSIRNFLNKLVADILKTMIIWIDHMIIPQIVCSSKCIVCEEKGEKTIPFSRYWNNIQDGNYIYCDLHKDELQKYDSFFSFRPNFGIIEI